MRILILALRYPQSLVGGYECTLCKLIEGYHRHGHEVDLMAFVPSLTEKVNRDLVDRWCDNVWLFEEAFVPSRRSPRRWLTVLHPLDSTAMQRSSRAFAERLRDVLVRCPPDVVQVHGYAMLQYRKEVGNFPCIAFPADCTTLALERDPPIRNPLVAARMALHRAKVRRMESTYGSYYATVFVTEADAARARQLSPGAHIVHMPNGVDADYFAPSGESVEPASVAFHGHMSFPPNVEAATWFLAKVWPAIKKRRPTARFLVVGAHPAEQILSAARGDPNVIITGLVPDIRPHLHGAALLAVPMQSGAGIKNKVLEGMALAKPIVATRMAVTGIDHAVPGRHFVLADTPAQFVDAICDLWQDPRRAASIGANARELVRTRYSWESMQDACELLLRRAVSGEVVREEARTNEPHEPTKTPSTLDCCQPSDGADQ